MKYCGVFLIIITFLSACTQKGIEQDSTKQNYLDRLGKLSDRAREKQLENDIEYVQDLLLTTQDLRIYNKNVAKIKLVSNDTINVEPFALISSDSLVNEFDSIHELIAYQKYGIPFSDFDIKVKDSLLFLNNSDFYFDAKNLFVKDKVTEPTESGLHKVDSLLVDVFYKFVTEADSVVISSSSADSIPFQTYWIDVVEKSPKSLKLIYPVEMEILDYRALAIKDSSLMHYRTYSDFSIFGIKQEVKDSLVSMIELLNKAKKVEDKTNCIDILNGISDEQFRLFNTLKSFKQIYDKSLLKIGNDNTRNIHEVSVEFIKEYVSILSPVSKELTLTFTKPIDRVSLYIATKHKILNTTKIIQTDTILSQSYKVFKDKTTLKYGILDKDLQILIPATYESLVQNENLYYTVVTADDIDDLFFYLDTTENILKPLPNNISFVKKLKAGIVVFENQKKKKGVLVNNKLEIVPFRYDDISIQGNTLIAKGSKDGKVFYELYSSSGKKINLPQIKKVTIVSNNPCVIVQSIEGKDGLIGKDGTVTIRPQYYGLKFLNNDLLRYNTDESYDEYSTNEYSWGVVSVDGKIIAKPQYYSIGFFADGMAPVYVRDKENLRGGYINEEGKVAIKPQFLFVNEFYKEYALVRVLSNYSLIDKTGKIIKNFPAGTYVELVDYEDRSKGSLYETSDGIDYDYKGSVLKD